MYLDVRIFQFSHPASVGRRVIMLIIWMRSPPAALIGAASCPPFTQLDKGAQALEVPQVAHLAPGPAQSCARLGRGPGFVLPSVLGALSPRGGTRALGSVWHCGAFSQFLLNDCGKTASLSRKWEDGFTDQACKCPTAISAII